MGPGFLKILKILVGPGKDFHESVDFYIGSGKDFHGSVDFERFVGFCKILVGPGKDFHGFCLKDLKILVGSIRGFSRI